MKANKDKGTSVGFSKGVWAGDFSPSTTVDSTQQVCKEHEWVESAVAFLAGEQHPIMATFCSKCGIHKPKTDFHIKDNLKVISDNEWEDIEAELMADPYPVDMFPEVTDYQLKKLHKLCLEKFGFPLDRFSAHIGRLIRKGIQEKYLEIKNKNT